MGIRRIIPQGTYFKKPSTEYVQPTLNKYVAAVGDGFALNTMEVEQFLLQYPAPMIQGNSGIRIFINDPQKGLNSLNGVLDLNIEVSEDKLEEFILKYISLYLFKEPNKFPLSKEKENLETPEDSEGGLDEIGITINDFKI